ncbi:MAG: capsular biosynthesis protein [Firmicutes bacterium HGW-Firmicutes-21]|nr:MAG: capsular biosynthesis protein [Firmicutes bacterium HGW-Firmicutes-21]
MSEERRTSGRVAFDYTYSNSELFGVQEAYKAIRTNIILSVIKDGCKKIVITSPLQAEGKSTTSVNIAISLAQAFNKVLFIDCDLRLSKVHKALGIARDPGVSNILSGLASVDESIQATKFENLFVLPAGITAPNPSEMLASSKMQELIISLEKNFDYIIMDTPPINIVSDALPLARLADGVAIVVRRKVTTHTELEKTIKSLQFINAKILGIILNDALEETGKRYKGGRYGKYGKNKYGYGYGYGQGYNYSYSSYSSSAKDSKDMEQEKKK